MNRSDLNIIDNVDKKGSAVTGHRFSTQLEKYVNSYKHSHRKSQLIYTFKGLVNCEVDDAIWLLPANCALWIAGNMSHCIFGSGDVECISLYIEPDAGQEMPQTCCTLSVSTLLGELIAKVSLLPDLYSNDSKSSRLAAVLLDEIADAPVEQLFLPMPRDKRLKHLMQLLLNDPGNRKSVSAWAKEVAMSERSLTRYLAAETGMSFGRWKRQMHAITAVKRLTNGDSLQSIAFDMGYTSSGSFVTMFKKIFGKPPVRYMTDQERKTLL